MEYATKEDLHRLANLCIEACGDRGTAHLGRMREQFRQFREDMIHRDTVPVQPTEAGGTHARHIALRHHAPMKPAEEAEEPDLSPKTYDDLHARHIALSVLRHNLPHQVPGDDVALSLAINAYRRMQGLDE